MRKTSTIFCWIGAVATTVFAFIFLAQGVDAPVTRCTYGYGGASCTTSIQHVGYAWWVWVLVIIGTMVRIILLAFRSSWLDSGSKVGLGIATILFVSVVGGILTLCIPQSELQPQPKQNKPNLMPDTPNGNQPGNNNQPTPPKPNGPQPLKFHLGDRVKTLIEIKTMDGVIPSGSIGVISVTNSRGEPEVTFEELKMKARVEEKHLKALSE